MNIHSMAVAALTFLAAALHGPSARAADQALIEAAKKEGQVVWYTTLIVNQFARPAAEAFEKKYGIKVNYVRANSTEVNLRIISEGQAGRTQADVFDAVNGITTLKSKNLVEKWLPDGAKALDPRYVDKEGYWVGTHTYVLTPAYNTDLIEPGTEPKTYQDLLDPKWKGKIVWNNATETSGAPGFIGVVLSSMGEEKGMAYLKQLSQQDIIGVSSSARQVLDQVIAGEYPVALNIFNHHAVISGKQGAPVAWIRMEPVLSVLSVAALTADAPHPNAGKLFLDFLASEEGQQIYRAANYLPVARDVPPTDPTLRPDTGGFASIVKTPEELDGDMPKWTEIYQTLFR